MIRETLANMRLHADKQLRGASGAPPSLASEARGWAVQTCTVLVERVPCPWPRNSSMMPLTYESDMEQLSYRLVQNGFGTRPAPYFAENGILAFTAVTGTSVGNVMEKTVFLYATPDGWCARITQHGGPHWMRVVEDISALERIALEALRRTETPPSSAWTED